MADVHEVQEANNKSIYYITFY